MSEGKQNYKKPKNVFMWLEPICNLRCNHCNIWKNESSVNLEVSKKKGIIKKLIDSFGGDFTLHFMGGELLLYDDIFDILKYSNKFDLKTSITSNGTLIDKKNAERIIQSGLTCINLSLDSVDPHVHDENRGVEGVHKKVLKSIDNLTSKENRKPSIIINTLVMRKNIHELPKLVKFADERNVDGIAFQPVIPPVFFGGRYNKSTLSNFYDSISSLVPSNLENVIIGLKNYLLRNKNHFEGEDFWPKFEELRPVLNKIIEMKKDGYPIKNNLKYLNKIHEYFKDPLHFSKKYECKVYEDLTIRKDGNIQLCPKGKILGDIEQINLTKMEFSRKMEKLKENVKNCQEICKILRCNSNDFYI